MTRRKEKDAEALAQMRSPSTLAQAAKKYRDNHHWVPLRLRGKDPRCMGEGWQKRTLADAIPEFEKGDNIGISLGAPSGWLVRLDPDFPAIGAVTDVLFPEPTAISGRASAPRSGRFYVCPNIKSRDFLLPRKGVEDDPRLPLRDGKPSPMVFQVLSTGKQSVAPPSIHPDCGEEITWQSDIAPYTLDAAELERRVGAEAFCMAVRQFWPARGSRNEAAMAMARVLLEAFARRIADEEERVAVVDALVVAVAMAGGDGEASRRGKERAGATLAKMKKGEETIGLTRLVELLELPPAVAGRFRQWLGVSRSPVPPSDGAVTLDDFRAYMPAHNFIFMPSREPWPGASVDVRLGWIPLFDKKGNPVIDGNGNQKMIRASQWLGEHRPVEQMTWAPGEPEIILDRLISEGGWFERKKASCLNLYRPPLLVPGNAAEADRWLDHVHRVYPADADHIFRWLAQRVQRPEVKVNHALVLGGLQGIGKDSLLEPVKHAVGPWNFVEVSPQHMLGRFNGFLKSVILRVSEARDLGDTNRYQFYDHMKSYAASPPDVLRVDEKYLREHSILNCTGVIITTNHKADGIYLPADDRRHYVAWSDLTKGDFTDDYWGGLWGWYARGGINHVVAHLRELDLSGFDPKAPPRKTEAFWAVVDANRAPEDAELADALDTLGNPPAVTVAQITCGVQGSFLDWLIDRKNRRAIPHRLEAVGYTPVRNSYAVDGYFVVGGSRCAVYARVELSIADRLKAVAAVVAANR